MMHSKGILFLGLLIFFSCSLEPSGFQEDITGSWICTLKETAQNDPILGEKFDCNSKLTFNANKVIVNAADLELKFDYNINDSILSFGSSKYRILSLDDKTLILAENWDDDVYRIVYKYEKE